MESVRVLIAHHDEAFRENLAMLLECRYAVRICEDGTLAWTILNSEPPDALILDLGLPNTDVMSMIQWAVAREIEVFAFSGFLTVPIQEKLLQMGVYGMLRTPCNLYQAECNIRAMIHRLPVVIRQRETDAVSEVLLRLNFQPEWDGYSQLLLAVPMYGRDPTSPLNKVIYADVARRFGLSGPDPVEYSIRSAIRKSCDLGDTELWKELFPPETRSNKSYPSSKQFIARLYIYLRKSRRIR